MGTEMVAGGSPEFCIGELTSSPAPDFPEIIGKNEIRQGRGGDVEKYDLLL